MDGSALSETKRGQFHGLAGPLREERLKELSEKIQAGYFSKDAQLNGLVDKIFCNFESLLEDL